jgi:hypothetical protein
MTPETFIEELSKWYTPWEPLSRIVHDSYSIFQDGDAYVLSITAYASGHGKNGSWRFATSEDASAAQEAAIKYFKAVRRMAEATQ